MENYKLTLQKIFNLYGGETKILSINWPDRNELDSLEKIEAYKIHYARTLEQLSECVATLDMLLNDARDAYKAAYLQAKGSYMADYGKELSGCAAYGDINYLSKRKDHREIQRILQVVDSHRSSCKVFMLALKQIENRIAMHSPYSELQ